MGNTIGQTLKTGAGSTKNTQPDPGNIKPRKGTPRSKSVFVSSNGPKQQPGGSKGPKGNDSKGKIVKPSAPAEPLPAGPEQPSGGSKRPKGNDSKGKIAKPSAPAEPLPAGPEQPPGGSKGPKGDDSKGKIAKPSATSKPSPSDIQKKAPKKSPQKALGN